MRRLARYCLVIVCTLALIGGSAVSFAASLSVNCAREHSHAGDTSPDHHKHHGSGCLSCCLGACVAVPDLPPRTAAVVLPMKTLSIAYWERDFSLPSRSIPPDLGPPRSRI
jgi:hypothetical protein